MKYRKGKIFTGRAFLVPEHIVRLDDGAMHGWQLRYGEWTLFSDHSSDGSGAKAALENAKKELMRRIDTLPAPTGLRGVINSNKSSRLPVGVSGPTGRRRKGRNVIQYYFQVVIPRHDDKPTNKSVYIGTENTISKEKRDTALAKAVSLRRFAERAYQNAKTEEKRVGKLKRDIKKSIHRTKPKKSLHRVRANSGVRR